ncbi:4'-phosphopantetheinyl transferase superfamily protein [Saccharopolyspora erythraea]|uniref:holo-ACP synthase n=1 Tax=Saccharopolyspora erythraea TaxID=1836 RepID=UPI001BEE6897|nr:4'-phosphopantetheinyl transferase superfamily protein [Saccharopolyspora erythraea]QUH05536.1 4'-phosphopantetheinyl transferase superfamily protein [Saccharopolyspora erythraea]
MSGATPGIGVDVLDRTELRRLTERDWFLRFAYAPEELASADELGAERRQEFLAGRFAAKEAVLKALGKGMLQGIAPREICVGKAPDGAPEVRLPGRRTPPVALSISHKQNVVTAVAISMPGRDDPAGARNRKEENGEMTTSQLERDTARATTGDEEAATTAFLRVRVGQEDAHYGGGLVDGARVLKLFGDLVTEITVRTDGDEGLLAGYSDVRFTEPVQPGDYLEATARMVRRTRLRRIVELQARKVIAARPEDGASAAEPLEEPLLVCSATATTVIPAGKAEKTGEGR